jgi:DNA-binding XRE family transcriptional regulator
MDGWLVHGGHLAKPFSTRQANSSQLRQFIWPAKLRAMETPPKPFADIAARIRWHRSIMGMTQQEYADRLGVKRSAFSLWEAGSHRLSLDGALALRNKYGLSLDFMYEGIADALPMTLRNAWHDKP